VVQTKFSTIFGLFAIIDRNENENNVVHLKEKTLKTSSKSAYKRQRNACSNYAPIERTLLRTRSVTKKQTPHFRTYSRRAMHDLPQTLHGDRDRRDHRKKWNCFSIQRIVFPTGRTEKFGLVDRLAVSQCEANHVKFEILINVEHLGL